MTETTVTLDQLQAAITRSVGVEMKQRETTVPVAPVAPAAAPAALTAPVFSDDELNLLRAFIKSQKEESKEGEDTSAGKTASQSQELTQMERGPLTGLIKGLDGIAGRNLPWGSALAGGFVALVEAEVINGAFPPDNADGTTNFTNPVVKAVTAAITLPVLMGFATPTAGTFAAGFLILDALRPILKIDEWVSKVVGIIPGTGNGTAGTGQARAVARARQQQQMAVSQRQMAPQAQVITGQIGTRVDVLDDVLAPN